MKMIWRTPKHHNRRKCWIIRWFFFFLTARAQNIVYWTYVKLKCTKVVNIFTDGLPCIPNAAHSASVAGDRARSLGYSCHTACIAGMDWQCFRTHTDFSEHAFSHGGCSKTMGCSCRHLVVHPWALAASQSSVRGWSHAPLVFKKSPWRLQLIKKKKILNLQCKTLQLEF